MDDKLPKALIRDRSRISLIWLVPLAAAAVAGWLVMKDLLQTGPVISIRFVDGNEIEPNQTVLRYRGVKIGQVVSVNLTTNSEQVEVRARLTRSAVNLAREGSVFWIVRPDLGSQGLHGLETIVSGPYIQVQPGQGPEARTFVGATDPPILDSKESGLEVVVTTPQLGTLNVGSPVYYRGMEVGSVRYFVLNEDASRVNVHLLIESNYSALVRTDSKFWNAGGINVNLKLFGINVSAESVKALVIGGIAFATPTDYDLAATNGTTYPLNEKVDDKWLNWQPSIPITNMYSAPLPSTPSRMLLNNISPNSHQ